MIARLRARVQRSRSRSARLPRRRETRDRPGFSLAWREGSHQGHCPAEASAARNAPPTVRPGRRQWRHQQSRICPSDARLSFGAPPAASNRAWMLRGRALQADLWPTGYPVPAVAAEAIPPEAGGQAAWASALSKSCSAYLGIQTHVRTSSHGSGAPSPRAMPQLATSGLLFAGARAGGWGPEKRPRESAGPPISTPKGVPAKGRTTLGRSARCLVAGKPHRRQKDDKISRNLARLCSLFVLRFGRADQPGLSRVSNVGNHGTAHLKISRR